MGRFLKKKLILVVACDFVLIYGTIHKKRVMAQTTQIGLCNSCFLSDLSHL